MVKTSDTTSSEQLQHSSEPKYKGVRKRKWGKWVSEIRLPNCRERIWLGSYDTAVKAARAFDAALFCLRGPDAKFNFPDNPPDIEVSGGRQLSPQEIQAVAARFANQDQEERAAAAAARPSTSTSNCLDDDMDNNRVMTTMVMSSGGSHTSHSSAHVIMEQCTTSSSSDGVVHVADSNSDTTTIDWSFWNMLDSTNGAGSDFSLYPALDNMNMSSGYYPPAPPSSTSFIDENGEDQNSFTHSSFLWNF